MGVFNVISAIFVETTMDIAEKERSSRRSARLQDVVRWQTNMGSLIDRLVTAAQAIGDDSALMIDRTALMDNTTQLYDLDLPVSILSRLGDDAPSARALAELDIDPIDTDRLDVILDPDSGGTLCIMDMVHGLKRLRGEPRRSDIITIDLMVREVQGNVLKILGKMESAERKQRKVAKCSSRLNPQRGRHSKTPTWMKLSA